MLCTFTGSGAVPPAGTVNTAIALLPRAQSFGQRVPAILVAVADQQNPPRSLRRKSAEGQLHRAFDVRGHAFLRVDSFRDAHLVRLRGNRTKIGAFRERDQPQLRAGIFANQIAQHGLAVLRATRAACWRRYPSAP